MMNEEVYQHYRKEEQPFIDQVYGWMQQVENRYSPYLSVFLTPRQAMIVEQLIGDSETILLQLFGGYEGAERKRALLYPAYYEPNHDDYETFALQIIFPAKFANISHGKILGTLIGAGIDRERIGDIITDGDSWHVIVDFGVKEYFKQNVTKIGNVGVRLEDLDFADLLESSETWETRTVIASSLRLDTLLAKVYNFSRQRAKDSVSSGMVKVNFMEMDRSDVTIGENDIVSLRKSGRFWIESIDGTTKKDNYRLTVNVLQV